MRVVAIVAEFPKLSETFIVSKAQGLLQRKIDLHLLCIARKGSRREFDEVLAPPELRRRAHGVRNPRSVFEHGWQLFLHASACMLLHAPSFFRYLRHASSNFRIKEAVSRFIADAWVLRLKPDLLHFEFATLAVDRMYLKDITGAGIIVSFRGYDANYAGLEHPAYYADIWRQADAIHVLGADLEARIHARGCPSNLRVFRIPPALASRFNQVEFIPHAGGSQLSILSVGRLEWKKGYEYALRACRIVHETGVPFEYHIVGDGAHYEAIHLAIHQLGLSGCVRVHGSISPDSVGEMYHQANVFLHAAVSEGFCNAVIEAQVHGLACVVTDADGLAENVIDGRTGFVVNRRDPDAMADKLKLLSEKPELRRVLGEAAHRHAREDFSMDRQLDAFEHMYRAVC